MRSRTAEEMRTYLHFAGNNSSMAIIQRSQRKKRTSRNFHSFVKYMHSGIRKLMQDILYSRRLR